MKKLGPIVFFSFGAPLALALSGYLLLSSLPGVATAVSVPKVLGVSSSASDFYPVSELLAMPSFNHKFYTADARSIIIRNYLQKYSSPLEPYAETIVQVSDTYSLDYRLLVAIARQESNLCHRIPPDSHNCWGFGIYGDKVTRFDNYPQALNTVAKTLKHNYIDQGLDTPEEIMRKYTPPSVDIGGPWAKAIHEFLSELE